ncbi:MAG: ArnT family glycosyltransferase, partial [Bacteroidia bacterium]
MPFLGYAQLFDWDEINFAECAREMMVTGDYTTVQINFEPFWEKPPLFIWMQVLCMKVFGVNEFAARLPNAIG